MRKKYLPEERKVWDKRYTESNLEQIKERARVWAEKNRQDRGIPVRNLIKPTPTEAWLELERLEQLAIIH